MTMRWLSVGMLALLAPVPDPCTALPEGECKQVLAPAPRPCTTLPEGERMQVLAAAPCARAAESSSRSWDAYAERLVPAYFQQFPASALEAGRHEHDGRLPDWSPRGLARSIAWLRGERTRAQAFDPAALDARQRYDRERLLAHLDKQLFWLEAADWPHRNPKFYADVLDPNIYVARPYAPLAHRLRAYIKHAKGIPAAARHIRANLKTPLPRTYVAIGRLGFGGLASYCEKDVPAAFADVKDAKLQAELRRANAAAVQALRGLDEWLAGQEASATQAFAIGEATFREMLRATEGVDLPLPQLIEIGERDLARNLKALEEACAAYAPGGSVADCVARARAEKPEGSPVAEARRQLDQLRAFVVDKEIVSIPGTERADVRESPPYQRWNFAYIDIPGPYEKGLPSTYFISPPDSSWPEAEQKAYLPGRGSLLFTSVHEVWPGHFLQYLHGNRSAYLFGRLFTDYAFGEGWAHYSEEMMWEAGLGRGNPELHVGQLLQALLRNVRFLSAIGLHTGGLTLEQSEQMFREKAFQDPGTARQQAARGTFDPAYLNYTLGKLMIRKLREDWTASRGGRAAWKAFHDELLSYGSPTVPLARRMMMGDAGSLF
jgi:hypothetical protein